MHDGQVAFGIEAPRDVPVDREEIARQKKRTATIAGATSHTTMSFRFCVFREGQYACSGRPYPTRTALRSAATEKAAERAERGLRPFNAYAEFREIAGRSVAVAVYALVDDSRLLDIKR